MAEAAPGRTRTRVPGPASPGLHPPRSHFRLRYGQGCVRVRSRRRAGSHGELRLHAPQAARLFHTLRQDRARPWRYAAWAGDVHPAGGDFALVRMDATCGWDAGKLLVSACAPPSAGELVLGHPDQEADQLAGLIDLEACVAALLTGCGPDRHARARAAARARRILARSTLKLMPEDGYCRRCRADVTRVLMKPGADPTACPLCWASWCD